MLDADAMWLATLGFALAFAAVTAAVVKRSALTLFDERIMAAITRWRTPRRDAVVAPLSMMATQEPLAVQSLVAFMMILVTIGGNAPLWFAVAAAGAGALAEGTKRVVRRPRPAGPHLIPWVRGTAYPSGDLLTAAAIYVTTALIVEPDLPSRGASLAMFGLVGTVLALLAVCRVLAGVHHPSDVVGGACAGIAWALLVAACLG